MSLQKLIYYLLLAFLFLLPWQTRWIYGPAYLNGGFWEYGTQSLYGTELLVGIIVLLFLIGKLADKEFRKHFASLKFKITKILSAGAFLIGLFFLTWHSQSWEISWQYLTRILLAVSLAVILASYARFNQSIIIKLITSLWLGAVVQGLFAIVQFFWQYIPASKWLGLAAHLPQDLGASVIEFGGERWLRAYGSFGSPNALGIFLGVNLLIGLLVLAKGRPAFGWYSFRPKADQPLAGINDRRERILFTIGQVIILSGLILSFSRGAWVATGLGLVTLLFIIHYSSIRDQKSQYFKQVVLYMVFSVVLAAALFPVLSARFNISNRLEKKSITERTAQFGQAWNMIKSHPILGIGPGVYTLALFKQNPLLPVWENQPVHNIYLLILAEEGVVLLLLILFIIHYSLFIVWQKNRLFFPVIITLLVAGLFDHWLASMWAGVTLTTIVISLGCGDRQWTSSGQVIIDKDGGQAYS